MPQATLTETAVDDLKAILTGLARYSRRAALRLRDKVEQECTRLARFPGLGTERTEFAAGLFSRAVDRKVIVYYTVTDDGIEVQRVLHGSRNINPSLFDLEPLPRSRPMPTRLLTLALILAVAGPAFAQGKKWPLVQLTDAAVKSDDIVYKKTPQGELKLHVFYPPDWKATDKRPVIVFFFGGGWKSGTYEQFVSQSQYFAARGIVAASADYRIASAHKTTPDVCVEDAKSAIRYVRGHAGELGIDPDKVIASGGSAGGHVAAATALVTGFDAADDPKVSAVPNAMVLYNPGLNYTTGGGRKIAGADGSDVARAISPTLYLTKETPPAVIFFGTADNTLANGEEYADKATGLGVRADLFTAADQPHGFFNRSPWIEATTEAADKFLTDLGYLTGKPTVSAKPDAQLKKTR